LSKPHWGIEVAESESSVEIAGVVDAIVLIKVAWRCPACRAVWQKRSHPIYGELQSCKGCDAKFFLRRPAV